MVLEDLAVTVRLQAVNIILRLWKPRDRVDMISPAMVMHVFKSSI
jgi:hypothetical protein